MKTYTFKTKLTSQGPKGAWTFLAVPAWVTKQLGTRARVSIKGTMNGFPFRTSIFPDGKGGHTMQVNKATMAGAKAKQGDFVRIAFSVDARAHIVKPPQTFLEMFQRSPKAKAFFDSLPPSHKREYIGYVMEAKKPETRERRIRQCIAHLEKQEKQWRS